MKDVLLRFWNNIKLPLVMLILAMIYMVVEELQSAGDFSTIVRWEFWSNSVYLLAIMALPSLGGALDKWLRDHGIYMEQVFNGFKMKE